MADAHGDAGTMTRDVVELQGAVTAHEVKDVGGVQSGAGKLATAADVEKEVAVSAKVLSEQKCDSGEDVYKGNFKSFKAKEVEKIKAKGDASFFNRKIKKWRCPYCTTKPKPKDGRFDHLVSHVEDVENHGEDYMIRGQHAALAKAVTPV
ncbi:lrr receptor-like serine threonine-protein kinase [Hordeum vulgare]|nr:lrr receptor-like serine threonine-protein kinase [Hordeum vulgare]